MVPNVAKRGTSFKGASAYYLHDKKQEGEHARSTTERVEWTHTRNLATDDAGFATRIMAATAMNKDELKRAAGVRLTGNKSKGDVYVYSLAWHPDEQGEVDKAEMMKAADQSLKALGAQDHQCVIVAHNDEPHPHIHVMVNMVNPHNGKNLPLSNDFKKLEKWAHDYRVERGEEHLYCPNRTEKMKAIEANKRGEQVEFKRGDKSTPRNAAADFAKAKAHANSNDIKALQAEQRTKDKALSDYGRKLHNRHGNEWAALSDNYKLQKAHISKQYHKDKAALKDEIFEARKPLYVEMLRQHRNQLFEQKEREKRIVGKFQTAFRNVQLAKSAGEKTSYIKELFSVVSGSGMERLKQSQAREIKSFNAEQKSETRQAVQQLNERRAARLSAARGQFQFDRKSLINKQRDEKTDLKLRWKSRTEQRKNAARLVREAAQAKKKEQEKSRTPEQSAAKKKTTTAREQLNAKARTRREGRQTGRTRSRTRKRD